MTDKTVDILRRRRHYRYDIHNSVEQLVRDIDRHGSVRRRAILGRLHQLLDGLDTPVPEGGTREAIDALSVALRRMDHRQAWLMIAILSARLPGSDQVRAAVRAAEADGVVAALRVAIWSSPAARVFDRGPFSEVRVVRNRVLVDVHHTAEATFATGIQRVTRESARRWLTDNQCVLVGWHPGYTALRELCPSEIRRACWGGPPVTDAEPGPVLVPVDCTYLLPELSTEPERNEALSSLAEHSGTRLGVIGHDLVPITVPETCDPGMPAAFAKYLSVVRFAENVATVSESSAVEYRGWAAMLRGVGLPGPRIQTCPLATEVLATTESDLATTADRLLIGGLPLVLVVGSHEPRKNHLAVLQAAELLWRQGERFSLTFIGGNSWNSDAFKSRLLDLQSSGRPIESISAASDALLWSAYRLARFTVFPSVSEGFGLPIVESLARGTPVITSNFGAMAENATGGGALLIDPRDDHELAEAMRLLLTDDRLHAELAASARNRSVRTWDRYAADAWTVLTQ